MTRKSTEERSTKKAPVDREAAAQARKRQNFGSLLNDVIEYNNAVLASEEEIANGEQNGVMTNLVTEMEIVMEPIDVDPTNATRIMEYGNPPLVKLGKVAADMIKVQQKFDAE